MCIAPSRCLAPPGCKHAVLPPPPFLYSAAGVLLCLVLWLCLRELGPVAASALLTGWLGTALHFKHLLGTTYRNGRLPGPLLNLGSRATFLALLAWTGGLPCRPPHVALSTSKTSACVASRGANATCCTAFFDLADNKCGGLAEQIVACADPMHRRRFEQEVSAAEKTEFNVFFGRNNEALEGLDKTQGLYRTRLNLGS